MTQNADIIPTVTFRPAGTGATAKANELGMRPMQARAYDKRGEQYLLIKSPPASGKSRALMFIALDKLTNQGVKKAIVCVPERSIGASFNSEPLSKHGFWADWEVAPQWNLCNTPGADDPRWPSPRSRLSANFWPAMPGCWSARMRPSALPLTKWVLRLSTPRSSPSTNSTMSPPMPATAWARSLPN
jgi:hypothetical protein